MVTGIGGDGCSLERALAPAVNGEAGIVVHGGGLFYRSRVPEWLAESVFSRLARLADLGTDLFWIPGNHKRSGVPRGLLLPHPRVRVIDRPRTFVVRRDGFDLALSGFPFAPDARTSFPALLPATGHADAAAGTSRRASQLAGCRKRQSPGVTERGGAPTLWRTRRGTNSPG